MEKRKKAKTLGVTRFQKPAVRGTGLFQKKGHENIKKCCDVWDEVYHCSDQNNPLSLEVGSFENSDKKVKKN
jgi:hypothetical protein